MIANTLMTMADKCLNCPNPRCQSACPLGINTPQIIKYVKEDNLEEAYKEILSKSYFGSVCSRVCSRGQQCEGECIRGISSTPVDIGEIEKAVSDWGLKNYNEEMCEVTLEKVAIVGSGPAGLACAIELRRRGYDVTIFERDEELGGLLRYGIPEYRLPKKVLKDVIDNIIKHEINVVTGKSLGEDFTIQSLKDEGYKAIFLAIGNDVPNRLDIDGIKLKGVCGARYFLRQTDAHKFDRVIVIGGGNVAIDVARTAKRKGASSVTVLYRGQKVMMKANPLEVAEAEMEGVQFKFESLPEMIVGDTHADGIICDDGETMVADTIILAIGARPNYNLIEEELILSEDYLVVVDENGETNIDGLFAGGDMTISRATVASAVSSGRKSAIGIDKKLSNKR